MADYLVTDTELTSVANAIRTRGGTSAPLSFPAGFVSAINDIPSGGSPQLTLGAIRPDATVFRETSIDTLLVTDEGITIPAYTTTDTTLVSASSDYISFDGMSESDGYDYYFTYRSLIYPIYDTDTKTAGRQDYHGWIEYFDLQKKISLTSLDTSASARLTQGSSKVGQNFIVYWSSASAITAAQRQGYGARDSGISIYTWSVNLSGNYTFKFKLGAIKIRGSTTYLNESNWNHITDIRVQRIAQLWRSPKNNLNLDGFASQQLQQNVISCAASPTHILT